ncbi:MAG: hypothetical protein AAF004_13040, partial [Pseudomonadota bacterium]
MHPSHHAASKPDHPALVFTGSGVVRTYAQLERRSNQIAQVMNEFKTMTEANMIVKGDIQYLPADAHGDGIVFKAAACH